MTGWWFQIYLHTSPIESWSLMRVSLRSPNHSDVRLGVLGLVTSTWDFSVESVLFVFNHRFDRRLPEEPPEGRPEPGSTGFFLGRSLEVDSDVDFQLFAARSCRSFSCFCSSSQQRTLVRLRGAWERAPGATQIGLLVRTDDPC